MFEKVMYIIYFSINFICFIIYGIDKLKAIRGKWRISEKTLLKFLVIGPFGGLIGMLLFRHKIRKTRFIVIVSLMLIVHIGLYVWYLI